MPGIEDVSALRHARDRSFEGYGEHAEKHGPEERGRIASAKGVNRRPGCRDDRQDPALAYFFAFQFLTSFLASASCTGVILDETSFLRVEAWVLPWREASSSHM